MINLLCQCINRLLLEGASFLSIVNKKAKRQVTLKASPTKHRMQCKKLHSLRDMKAAFTMERENTLQRATKVAFLKYLKAEFIN
jgi:hypothetical protein